MMELNNWIKIDQDAELLFKDSSFLFAWEELYKSCPWATIFQSKDFVLNWYHYFQYYPKILVTDWNGKSMSGLLTLSFVGKNTISAAGFDQAEYQVWLSTPESKDHFISKAINQILKYYPGKTLYLKYLPSKTPVSSFELLQFIKYRYYLKPYVQPLIKENKTQLEFELKKKNKKEKINRLKRLGTLKFYEVKNITEFRDYFDEMAMQSDLRKGALYDKMIFKTEPQRKKFLLKMFELGHLHVSVLKLNEIIIASNAGFKSPDMIHLQGINSHSPFFSKYSPGILHFLMLGIHLEEIEVNYFDLTPGGKDGYKSMLSNTTEIAYELWISDKKYVFFKKLEEKLKFWLKEVSGIPIFQKNNFSDLGLSIKNYFNRTKLRLNKNYLIHGTENLNYLQKRKIDISYCLLRKVIF
jgi:hypothetical protein